MHQEGHRHTVISTPGGLSSFQFDALPRLWRGRDFNFSSISMVSQKAHNGDWRNLIFCHRTEFVENQRISLQLPTLFVNFYNRFNQPGPKGQINK